MAKIWDRQSFGLYDFTNKNKNLICHEIFLTKDCEIVILPQEMQVACVLKGEFTEGHQGIKRISLSFDQQNLKFVGNGPSISDHLWERLLPGKELLLKQNDVLRIGKIVLIT